MFSFDPEEPQSCFWRGYPNSPWVLYFVGSDRNLQLTKNDSQPQPTGGQSEEEQRVPSYVKRQINIKYI